MIGTRRGPASGVRDGDPCRLTVDSLSIAYGPLVACRDISLIAESESCLSIVGANGAGKSTLLNGVAGAIPTKSGRVVLNGVDITALPAHRRARAGLALVPEGNRVLPLMTVRENLQIAQKYARPGRWSVESVEEFFPALAERRASLGGNLSGGERQMLAMGRALMLNPKILLLDEPTAGLAPALVKEVLRTIESLLAQGMGIVLVEQNVFVARRLASSVIIMGDGVCKATGGLEVLEDDEAIRRTYLGTSGSIG